MNKKTMMIILAVAVAGAAAWFLLRRKIASPNAAVALPPVAPLGGAQTNWLTGLPPVGASSGSLAVTSTVKGPSAANMIGSVGAAGACLAYGGGPLCGVAGAVGGYAAAKSYNFAKGGVGTAVSAAKNVGSTVKGW